jgi:putative ABC transport system permease protein
MRPTGARPGAPGQPGARGFIALLSLATYLPIATIALVAQQDSRVFPGGIAMLWSDLKFAVRGLIGAPGLSAAAVLALALGIGPNTAIFSIVYATLLVPLPYSEPDQLVRVSPMMGESQSRTSPAEYLEWKERATSFQSLEAFWPGRALNLATADAPERVVARQVTPGGYRIFGDGIFLGRDFHADEGEPGKQHVVLLSHRLWRERFGADRTIIGRDIRMDSIPYTVVGVLAPGHWDRTPANVWIPISLTPAQIANRQFHQFIVDGRLKPGVTIEQAQHEMDVIAADLARRFPDSNAGRTVRVVPLATAIVDVRRTLAGANLRTLLWSLLAAVSFVVLMACVNVANLLLSRGATREHEIAIRAALGASRGHLVRLAMMEGLVLAAVGGALGTLASVWILDGILAMLPPNSLASTADPRLNLPVLLFAIGAAMFAGALCGSAQAWQAARTSFNETLKQASRSATGHGRRRLRHALVVVEFALAVTLLAGAGLMILSFWNRTRVDLGIRTDHILTFGLPVNNARFSSAAEIDGFYRQILERIQAVPGVAEASVSSGLPLLGLGVPRTFSVIGQPEAQRSLRPSVGVRMVTPGFFETFGIRMMQGRALTDRDNASAQGVVVVNERFVRLFLNGQDPIGQHVAIDDIVTQTGNRVLARGIPSARASSSGVEWQIVGVFRDVSNAEPFGEPKAPEIYVPFAQSPWATAMVAVRTTTRPELLRSSLAAAVNTVAPALPLVDVRTMEQIVGERLAPDGFNMVLYGGLAALALILATLGIYAVMAFTVVQRTAEIGLRMALGAGHNQVRLQILREGATLAASGLILGLVGAYALGRAMQAMLFGTGALSVPVVLVAGLVLLGAALVACYVPARRASAVDPLIALRQS